MADLAEYAFGISIGIVLFSCYILLNVPPKEWPNAKPRRPSTPTPPPPEVPATTEPYSEEAIVSAMTALYQFLIDLDIIRPDQITFAPEAGHSISTELCESLHLDPKVISLMKWLPYPIDRQASWEFDLLDESRTPPYTDDNDIKDGRDPDFPGIGDGPRLDYLAPTDIALTIGGRYGVTLVLDTQESLCLLFYMPLIFPCQNDRSIYLPRNAGFVFFQIIQAN